LSGKPTLGSTAEQTRKAASTYNVLHAQASVRALWTQYYRI